MTLAVAEAVSNDTNKSNFDKWDGTFDMPSHIDRAGHIKALDDQGPSRPLPGLPARQEVAE